MPIAAFPASPSPGLSEANDHNLEDLMSVLDVFWIFFMLSALQPVIRQRLLDGMRMRKIAQLERDRHSRVILLVHRQETMKLLGFPVMRYIDVNDSEEVLRAIHMTDPDVPLDLVLHTPGGLVLAMSGGTLIALAADEIVMSRHAVLGPIDPQLGESPAASLLTVVEKKPISEIDDKTLILADVGRKAIDQVKMAAQRLLARRLPADQAEALAQKLATGTWTHDYPIAPEEARELGLPVSTEIPDRVLELMALYPQPVHTQQGGVEYLPVPRQKEPSPLPL
jgi:ClpP class serine protease